ncbi:MAG: glycosyltransferase family 25 protein, partial [Planctomycetes bacterium]|nr:glycosyltransferase family 25 protein [Planctomycetota bacterium]
MSSPCPIFLINLPGSHARLQDAERQFRGAWLEFERIEAVDGRKLPPDELARLAPDNRGAFYHRLTPGEIGCYLSHLRAVRTIVDRSL